MVFSLTPGWAALSKNQKWQELSERLARRKREARMHHASGHMVSLLERVAGGETFLD